MRWLVEVSSLGNTDLQKFCVEAESWQRALQTARAQRGEDGPMSGFSIELLEEGYRAVDPVARVRFVVRRAPDDMPVTVATVKDKNTGVAPAAPIAVAEPAAPAPAPAPVVEAAPPPATPPADIVSAPAPAAVITPSAAGLTEPALPPTPSSSALGREPPRPAPSSSASVNATASASPSAVPRASTKSAAAALGATPPSESKRKVQTIAFGSGGAAAVATPEAAPERPPVPPVGAQLPGLPPVKVLAVREQEPTETSPLTYREYALAIPDGTSEEVAVDVLRSQLRLVEAHIAAAKMGKLVNLAVFDVEFVGKPPRPPIATLMWKDWKGEPTIAYPRRTGASMSRPPRPPSQPPPSMLAATSNPGTAPIAPPPAPVPDVAAIHAAAAAPAPEPTPAPPPAVETQPIFPAPAVAPAVTTATAPAVAPATIADITEPAPPVAVAPAPEAPPASTTRPSTPPQPARPPSNPPPPGTDMVRTPSGRFVRGRITGDELITALFESMHDLHFLRDALDGGQFCLALATEVLPSRAAFIHFYDIERREWVVACTRGKDTQRLLNARTTEGDELLREAARKRRAIVTPNAAELATAQRYQALGGGKSLIIAPIMQAGRALGAIEIVNPLDGMPFNDDEGNAMTYIAEQYAEYLGSRGIVLDRERIHAAAVAR